MRGFWRRLVSDDQLRWLGPEKGVMHLATAAVVNAVWDLWAKRAGLPLWQLLASTCPPEDLVACIDFRYIDDVLTPEEALDLLQRAHARARKTASARSSRAGYPAYTTSAGWLGYDDEKVEALVRQALADGFRHVKMKVGSDLDVRRRGARR